MRKQRKPTTVTELKSRLVVLAAMERHLEVQRQNDEQFIRDRAKKLRDICSGRVRLSGTSVPELAGIDSPAPRSP